MIQALLGLLPSVFGLIDQAIPDKDKAAEIKAGLQTQLIELQAEQIKLNVAEARHPSLFVAGWRPAVGWLCAGALAWTYLMHPLLTWAAFAGGWETLPPTLDTEDLILLLGGMLGFGGFRSFEKVRGAARSGWTEPAAGRNG